MLLRELGATTAPRLMAFGKALGYAYPDNPLDLLPDDYLAELAPEPSPSPEPLPELQKMESAACEKLLRKKGDLVVEPASGLIWCTTADSAISMIFDHLNSTVHSKDMNDTAIKELCFGTGATSFTIVRNPWERLLSTYIKRVIKYGDGWVAAHKKKAALEKKFEHYREYMAVHAGKEFDETDNVTFAQFARWVGVQPKGTMSSHWVPTAVRCDPEHVPYSLVAHHETIDIDTHVLFHSFGWDYPEEVELPASSLATCATSWTCAKALEWQLGPDWKELDMDSALQRLFNQDPLLVSLVSDIYGGDGSPYGYTPYKVGGDSVRTRADVIARQAAQML